MLNGADGMDWQTFCDCSCLYAVKSADLFGKRGHVTLERLVKLMKSGRSFPVCHRLTSLLPMSGSRSESKQS